jgi:CrcB protein
MFRTLLLVGLGGCFGSIARYAATVLVNKWTGNPFPLATLTVNLLGCFAIGLLFGWAGKHSWAQGDSWLFLASGFCGGFTTFSAFALDNILLFNKQLSFTAVLYTIASVLAGLLLCRIGLKLTA